MTVMAGGSPWPPNPITNDSYGWGVNDRSLSHITDDCYGRGVRSSPIADDSYCRGVLDGPPSPTTDNRSRWWLWPTVGPAPSVSSPIRIFMANHLDGPPSPTTDNSYGRGVPDSRSSPITDDSYCRGVPMLLELHMRTPFFSYTRSLSSCTHPLPIYSHTVSRSKNVSSVF